MDLFRPRAIPSLVALGLTFLAGSAFAECEAIAGTYFDESVEKIGDSPRLLSSFASPKDRTRLVKSEPQGSAPTFGGNSGQVMQRPKTTKLVTHVDLKYEGELKFRYRDTEDKVLLSTSNVTPARWKCVNGHLERKFQMATGLGDVMRTEEVNQKLTGTPGGDLKLTESRKTIEGPKGPPEAREVHFKRK